MSLISLAGNLYFNITGSFEHLVVALLSILLDMGHQLHIIVTLDFSNEVLSLTTDLIALGFWSVISGSLIGLGNEIGVGHK